MALEEGPDLMLLKVDILLPRTVQKAELLGHMVNTVTEDWGVWLGRDPSVMGFCTSVPQDLFAEDEKRQSFVEMDSRCGTRPFTKKNSECTLDLPDQLHGVFYLLP